MNRVPLRTNARWIELLGVVASLVAYAGAWHSVQNWPGETVGVPVCTGATHDPMFAELATMLIELAVLALLPEHRIFDGFVVFVSSMWLWFSAMLVSIVPSHGHHLSGGGPTVRPLFALHAFIDIQLALIVVTLGRVVASFVRYVVQRGARKSAARGDPAQ